MKPKQTTRETPRTNDKRRHVGAKVSEAEWRKFHARGGSVWLRKIMREAP